MHAARDKPTRVRSAGLRPVGGCGPGSREPDPCGPGPCGPDPAEGGRASSRSILASCSVRRVSCSSARLICSWACASPSSARATGASWGLISFGSGVEFIGVSLFRPMSSEGGRSIIRQVDRPPARCPALSKEWPYDGENGRMTEEYGRGIRRATAGGEAETARRLLLGSIWPARTQIHAAKVRSGHVRTRCESVGRRRQFMCTTGARG